MRYELSEKQELSGMSLVVGFPQEELDKKAFYTMQGDRPPFALPFSYVSIDGRMECSYHPGSMTRLKYRYGEHDVKTYISLWEGILRPLIDCGDWFAKPFSFVLSAEQLFIDKNGQIGYIYVPTAPDCSRYEDLTAMVSEIAKQNHVTDARLEVQVLQAIMQDFRPEAFLDMLRKYGSEQKPAGVSPTPKPERVSDEAPSRGGLFQEREKSAEEPPKPARETPVHGAPDDLFIDLDGAESKKPSGGRKKAKPEKSKPEPKAKSVGKGLFGGKRKKSEGENEVILGAAREEPNVRRSQQEADNSAKNGSSYPGGRPSVSVEADGEVTQLDEESGAVGFRLVGRAGLPQFIPVGIQAGECFTIGRFDVSVGRKQNDFEFDKSTHAVSRRHAVVERSPDGYSIQDLVSKAGTYLDGTKLTPNVPYPLARGRRVSFGTGGADYIWEE